MSTNKTANYELSQWELNDKPVMDEFNEDNKKIDTALSTKVDKEVLTEYNLPLSSGLVPYLHNTYNKNQFGQVSINLSIKSTSGNPVMENNSVIAMLPVGYRPANAVDVPAMIVAGQFGNSQRTLGSVVVNPDGTLRIWTIEAASYVAITTIFTVS